MKESAAQTGLAIIKLGYSRSPWRITWNGEEIQHLYFDRKRDAVPFFNEAREIIGECSWNELTTEQRESLASLIRKSPSFQSWVALVTRQATSPFL